MKLQQILQEEAIITEGIVFFKSSKKINRLINTIQNRAAKIEEQDKKQIIMLLIGKLEKLQQKFELLEKEYITTPDKKKLKREYKAVEKEFTDVLQVANKEQTKAILKNIGVYGIMVASLTLPYKLIDEITKKFGIINNSGIKTLNPFAKAGVFFGVSSGLQLIHPSKLIEKKYNPNVVEKSLEAMKSKNI